MPGDMNPTTCLAGACLFFIVIPSAILLFNSFQSLQPIEYGLNFNAITMSVEEKTYSTAGLYFLGFGHWFIRFPRVIQVSAHAHRVLQPAVRPHTRHDD